MFWLLEVELIKTWLLKLDVGIVWLLWPVMFVLSERIVHVYCVVGAIISAADWVITGEFPLQIKTALSDMEGVGVTVTATLKLLPVQFPEIGVTV